MKKKARQDKRTRRHKERDIKDIFHDKNFQGACWRMNIPTDKARWIGLTSEEKVVENLEIIKRNKLCFGEIGIIKEITRSVHRGKEDSEEIDITVEFSKGAVLFIEVKNSADPKRDLLKSMEKMSDRDRCFLVMPWETRYEDALELVIGTIKWWFGQFNK